MKTVCIVQARLGSTRLPRKILADIKGKPMLWHVVERAGRIEGVDEVVVAVPSNEDLEIAAAVPTASYFVGHPTDVLDRYFRCALAREADVVVRVTSDCPLLDSWESSRLLKAFRAFHMDFADNVAEMADGLDTEVFTFDLLRQAAAEATDIYDREHVTPWMRRNARRRLHLPPRKLPAKWSVDTEADLERVRQVLA